MQADGYLPITPISTLDAGGCFFCGRLREERGNDE